MPAKKRTAKAKGRTASAGKSATKRPSSRKKGAKRPAARKKGAKRPAARKKTTGAGAVGAPLSPPANGVAIRMYRQGHGDCFLLALPREGQATGRPVYVMIDCGLKVSQRDAAFGLRDEPFALLHQLQEI